MEFRDNVPAINAIFFKNRAASYWHIHNIKEECPHTDKIQSLYGILELEEVYGYILCLSCAIERWPDPDVRSLMFLTEIGYIGDWAFMIVADVTCSMPDTSHI